MYGGLSLTFSMLTLLVWAGIVFDYARATRRWYLGCTAMFLVAIFFSVCSALRYRRYKQCHMNTDSPGREAAARLSAIVIVLIAGAYLVSYFIDGLSQAMDSFSYPF
jgi:hypothetical protein